MMMNSQRDLAGDPQRRTHEQIQGMADHALGRVLHRNDPEIAGPRFHLAKDLVDGRHRRGDHRMAEVLDGRGLRKGAFRPQKGRVERSFQRQAGGHDLAKETGHFLAVQRTRIGVLDPAQHRDLALRTIELNLTASGFSLEMGDLLGAAGTLADQPQ